MRNSIYALSALRRTIAVITLSVLALAGVISGRPARVEQEPKKGLSDVVADALRSPRASNEIDSRAGSPISVIDSSSVEIPRKVYQKLTGTRTTSPKAASYPKVTLLNTSDTAVTEVLLILSNKATGKRNRLKISNINIRPQDVYVVDPEKWMIPALINGQKPKPEDQGRERVVSRKDVLRHDSNLVWMVGRAADLSITVGMAGQSNGAKWDILGRNRVSGALPTLGNGLRPRPVAYNPATPQGCWCAGEVICWDDGSFVCWGECFDCSMEDCALCAAIGCTVTCMILT